MHPREALWLPIALVALGCGATAAQEPRARPHDGVGARAPRDFPLVTPERVLAVADGVVRETMIVDGFVPPPNPVSEAGTPEALDRTTVLRFREDATPPRPVRAVIVALPGFLSGAGALEPLAVALVAGARDAGGVEVWAIDRRSNNLEDPRGFTSAEAARDPEIARAYYYEGATLDGVAFDGFVDAESASFASEWGLATHAEDIRRIVGRVAESDRRGHVFLLGHSLGAWMAEAYGAWRFADGVRGAAELAGIVLLDGTLDGDPVSEAEYLTDGFFGPGFQVPPVAAIRTQMPVVAAPGLFPDALVDVLALRARFAPDAVVEDPMRDERLARTVLSMDPEAMPRMTNAAALGFYYDSDYQPNFAISVSMGRAVGGPMETYGAESPFGPVERARPSDPGATYRWVDGPDLPGAPDHMRLDTFATAWTRGGVDGVEHYFPLRLVADLYAVQGNAVAEDGWQAREGLRAFDGPRDDAPFLGVIASGDVSELDALRGRLAPTIGEGRPHAGAQRTSEEGFEAVHVDLLHAETTLAPGEITDAVLRFVGRHSASGAVTVR